MLNKSRLHSIVWMTTLIITAAPTEFLRDVLAADRPIISLQEQTEARCLTVLREGLQSQEFWPSMHAAEALTLAGYGEEVREALTPLLETLDDDQQRCGVARELVRAGDRSYVAVMLSILADKKSNGHIHACESLYKVNELGDGELIRAAFVPAENNSKTIMAAAALARWGNPQAMKWLRETVQGNNQQQARLAAWVLAVVGEEQDIPPIRQWADRLETAEESHFFVNALATLGDRTAQKTVLKNLTHSDAAVRTYAAVCAGEARLTSAQPQLIAMLDDENLDASIRAAQSLLVLAQPTETLPVDLSGNVYPASKQNPRYSEGSILSLPDGSLLYATTEFHNSGSDFAQAHIVARRSTDQGQTWEKPFVLQPNTGKQNVMSVTLRYLAPASERHRPIGMFYVQKNSHSDLKVYLRISEDEGKRFGNPIVVTNTPGYHVFNNDRATQLSSGRWLIPVASTSDVGKSNHFVSHCFLSDDQGKTWRAGQGQVDYEKRGAMEPEVIELSDGRVQMLFRTQSGHIGSSLSTDGGETWSQPVSYQVVAPEAPATIRRIPSTGDLMLVWNHNYEPGKGHSGKRNPLTVAISSDEGASWKFEQNLEADPTQAYSYISLLFDRGRALFSYYVQDGNTKQISSRFRSLPISWFYAADPSLAVSTAVESTEPEVVLALPPQGSNARNSEGDFIELKDGRLMFIYSHFVNGAGDHSSASLQARFSSDQGKTWTTSDTEILPNEGGMNVMSVSLLRLPSEEIALFYLRKNSLADCRPCVRFSQDEGKTWSEAVVCIPDEEIGYYVLNNNRAIQLQSGRLVLPLCRHSRAGDTKLDMKGEILCYLSDDQGRTWRCSKTQHKAYNEAGQQITTQEPGVVELKDGRVMMLIRSTAGCQLISYSADGAETWSPMKTTSILSPVSPASIERIPQTGDLLLIWNDQTHNPPELKGKRTPLTAAISRDEGASWEHVQNIWTNPNGWYCYMAIHFTDDAVLLGNCAGDRTKNNGLAETHITRIPLSWIYEKTTAQ